VLDDFQESRQNYRAHARADSDAQDRQPKARRPGLQKGRRDPGIIGLGRLI
jgi:hypothetical protein